MSTEEREAYLSENRDRGNKRYSYSSPILLFLHILTLITTDSILDLSTRLKLRVLSCSCNDYDYNGCKNEKHLYVNDFGVVQVLPEGTGFGMFQR